MIRIAIGYISLLGFMFALFACVQPMAGQSTYAPEQVHPLSESWRWRQFPVLEGKGVSYIETDADESVWFAVNEGILEYNGHTWTWHNEQNGLEGSPVQQILATSEGRHLATTSAGLFEYDGESWSKRFDIPPSITPDMNFLKELSDGSIVMGGNAGLFQFREGENVRCFTSPENLASFENAGIRASFVEFPEDALIDGNFLEISDILEDRYGRIWIGLGFDVGGKIMRIDPARDLHENVIRNYTLFDFAHGVDIGEAPRMIETINGEIWVINTSFKVGISVFNGSSWRQISLSDWFGGDEYTTDIVQTRDGTIWIGSLGKLYTYENNTWQLFKSPAYKIPPNKLMLFHGHDDEIWIGSFKSSAYLLDYSKGRWSTLKNLNFQCEGADGSQYFLDVSGKVVTERDGKWNAFDQTAGIMQAPVRLFATSRGQIWAAGSHEGSAATSVHDGNTWTTHVHPNLSWGIDYRAVFESENGALWFGGAVDIDPDKGHIGGVLEVRDPESENPLWIHHKYHENGLNQSNAYGIGQSADGTIWLGGGSLYKYDGQSWERSPEANLRQFVNVVTSKDGLLAVGSRYYGIFFFDGKTWRHFDNESGLTSNSIFSIYIESPNRIWAATENDISLFDGSDWVNFVFPSEMNLSFEGGSLNGSSDGRIWVNKSLREWKRRALSYQKSSEETFQNFYTHRYQPETEPPETTIDLYSQTLSHRGNNLITWKGYDYFGVTPGDRLQFSYNINGEGWSPFSKDLQYRFLNLPAGTYSFAVRARDLDFNVDPTPAEITFKVQSPVWLQPWFIILILAFLVTIAIFEYRVITKKQKLEKLNASLHKINDELKIKSRQIEKQNDEILQQQDQILAQKKALEDSYESLQMQNVEIQDQKNKLEEMVVQIENLSKSKINFFTNISHELRTPLTLILGPIQQLKDGNYDLTDEEQCELKAIIERNAFQLLKLINQLLEMRRIEQTTLELNPRQMRIGMFLSEIISLFDNLAREKGIALQYEQITEDLIAELDPDKVEKIITNLLSNAFKNTKRGDAIIVRLKSEQKNVASDEFSKAIYRNFFRIEVEDTGCGIKEEQLEHIFDRYFHKGDDQLSTGIGLSYIKDLVSVHGGEIHVQSRPEEGTKFTIILPQKATTEPHSPEEVETGKPSLGFTSKEAHFLTTMLKSGEDSSHTRISELEDAPAILLIEDNLDMLAFLEGLLCKSYRIFKATNGKEGILAAREHAPDIILSDVMMPEMDGIAFCSEIKSNILTCHIPVILLTAKTLDDHILEGFTTGADDYITKPFNPALLEARIANLLKQRRQLQDKYTRDVLTSPGSIQLSSPDDVLLHRIKEIMEEHIDDGDFNVNSMCSMVNISHTHFIRKIKQLTGKKPVDLLKSFRLQRAKDLLSQNKANIAEVAYMVGYNLPNSFSRAFKKEFSISPTEFLERQKGEGERV